jgi:hypothetical protein
MAKTGVTLKAGDYKEREVLELSYQFTKATDPDGQIAGTPRGGKITMKVRAHNKTNVELLDWLLSKKKGLNGSIEIKNIWDATLKKIKFVEGHCIDYLEEWKEGYLHSEKIIISCKEISINEEQVKYAREWE